MLSHGLDFAPNFTARSSVIFYLEIKWTTCFKIGRPTADVLAKLRNWTSLSACLEHFGLKLSWLSVLTSGSGFRWPLQQTQQIQGHRHLPSTETKLFCK